MSGLRIAAVQTDSRSPFRGQQIPADRVLIGVVWFGNRLAARNARDAERVVARIVDWGETGTMAGPFLFAFMISDNPDSESAR